jgi:hypothetical protein
MEWTYVKDRLPERPVPGIRYEQMIVSVADSTGNYTTEATYDYDRAIWEVEVSDYSEILMRVYAWSRMPEPADNPPV